MQPPSLRVLGSNQRHQTSGSSLAGGEGETLHEHRPSFCCGYRCRPIHVELGRRSICGKLVTRGRQSSPNSNRSHQRLCPQHDRGRDVDMTSSLANVAVGVTAAQRTFGGTWSSPVSIASVRATSLPLTVAISANDYAAATWEDVIALRSPAGVWRAPVSLGLTGTVSDFQAQLDAQGNGVAVWGRLTDTNSLVEADNPDRHRHVWKHRPALTIIAWCVRATTGRQRRRNRRGRLARVTSAGQCRPVSSRVGDSTCRRELERGHDCFAKRATDLGVRSGARWVR